MVESVCPCRVVEPARRATSAVWHAGVCAMRGSRVAGAGQAPVLRDTIDLLAGRRRDAESRWYVLHTRSRQEKALETSLRGMGIGCYLPLHRVPRPGTARRTGAVVPLFAGYVFLWGTRDEVYLADRTRRVAGLIEVGDQAGLEWELSNVSLALRAGACPDPLPGIRRGVRVRVATGPFEGVEGIVSSRDAADRLVLQVRMLNTAASLDIDGALVEPLTG